MILQSKAFISSIEPSTLLQDEGITNSFNLFPERPYCLISRILFGRIILVRLQFDKRLTSIMLIPVKNLNSWKAFEDLFLNCGIIVPMEPYLKARLISLLIVVSFTAEYTCVVLIL